MTAFYDSFLNLLIYFQTAFSKNDYSITSTKRTVCLKTSQTMTLPQCTKKELLYLMADRIPLTLFHRGGFVHDTRTPINRKQPKKQDKMNTKLINIVLLKLSILYSCTTQHSYSSDSVITEKKQFFLWSLKNW